MAIAEDRRRLTTRLIVLQVAVAVAFALLVGGFWFFQVFQHAKFREMAENNHQRTLPLRAPRGVIFDRTRPACSSRTAPPSTSRSSASTPTTSIARSACWRRSPAVDEDEMREIVERHRREPTYRPIVVSRTRRWRRWRR